MIRFAVTVALAASFLLGSSPRDASALPPGGMLPPRDGGIIIIDDPVFDPGNDDPDLACFAQLTAVDAKLAKSLVRCQRLERLSPDEFNYNACKRKVNRKHRKAMARLACKDDPGQPGGGVIFKYTCSGLMCTCVGDDDCNDMFTNAGCGDVTSCDRTDEERPVCSCLISLG